MSSQQRIASAVLANVGLIAVDEHTSVSCMIHDVTATGLSLTLLDALEVPADFILTVGFDTRVCRVVRRTDEGIEASFAELGMADRAARTPVRTARVGSLSGIRRFANEQSLRRAA